MMYVAIVTALVLGVNTLFWGCVGLLRIILTPWRRASLACQRRFGLDNVAILIPAHNEESVLLESLQAVAALLPIEQIYVVSDGSSDRTVAIAKKFGTHVLDLQPNQGKAGAIVAAIEKFGLAQLYAVMLLVDADTRLSPDYLVTGLPLFDDPKVIAVAGWARGLWDPPPRTLVGKFLVSYRSRLYAVTQILVKYGQAAKWANVVSIVPGFASMYRTDILHQIDITAPGMVIEDFNMTFEIHAKKLGRVAFRPHCAVAYTQDPDTVSDYLSQIRRWTLGYWQTVRRHGLFHVGKFWLALTLVILELVTSSITLLCMPLVMAFAIYGHTLADTYGDPTILGHSVVATITPLNVALGFLLPDMFLTIFAAIALRRPNLLLLILLFPLMRFVEAFIALRCIPAAWLTTSTGQWVSPTRRENVLQHQAA